MATWQFSLFFVALLIGYVLVHVRLSRAEEHLRHLAGIRTLDDRLQAILSRLEPRADAPERLPLQRIEAQLQRLHEDLEDLREATTNVREAVIAIPPPPSRLELTGPIGTSEPAAAPAVSRSERLRGVVETRLLQLGYANVNLLTDLSQLGQGDADVVFEAERRHMPIKGRVLLRNDGVRDVVVHTAAPMFP
ncbi:MAG: hypothetical protein IPK26_05805 [Planctomycetes bacterium]|nr:hypothetical protein [Planctomycetota bacterium]